MPASGLTGVAGVAGVGGGGGGGGEVWTRVTLASDYTNPTAAVAIVPDLYLQMVATKSYRIRGRIIVKNVGAAAYTLTSLPKYHSYTAVSGCYATTGTNGQKAGGLLLTTFGSLASQPSGSSSYCTFEAIATCNAADGQPDSDKRIEVQLSSTVANTICMLAGSFIEVQEIT